LNEINHACERVIYLATGPIKINFMKTAMRKIFALMIVTSFMLAACVVVPVDNAPHGNFCPPGQAKKGNCAPDSDRGFCPPGQAKKGAC
jgi:hypothetical protein